MTPLVSVLTGRGLTLLGYNPKRAIFPPHVRESGFRNPANFCLWNPESWALESGIQLKDSGIHQRLESGTQFPLTKNPKFSSWNPESKTVLDILTESKFFTHLFCQ